MAITQVMKMTEYIEGKGIPLTPLALEGFPWAAACSLCPWTTSLGGWRDTFDFAFVHARGHHIDMLNGMHSTSPAPEQIAAIIIEQALAELTADDEETGYDEDHDAFRGRWGTE
jgi:hypothetical protein